MQPSIDKMDAQQLKAALKAENLRIEGANVMREKIQIGAVIVAIIGTITLLVALKNGNSQDCLALALWGGCTLVYWQSKPKPLHFFHGDNWEGKAREVLSDAEWERFQRSRIKREAENEDN